MKCVDYRLDMLPYLKHDLSSKQMRQLLAHVMECPTCKEELKVQYMVMEGMKRLEYGGTFNLAEDFEKELVQSLHEAGQLERVKKLMLILLSLGICVVFFVLFNGIFG